MYEFWKDLVGYEGLYQVSTLGNIRSIDRIEKCGSFFRHRKGKVLKQVINRGGYCQVTLTKDGKGCSKEVHRLIAKTFIENEYNLPEVNHIDCDKTNNSVDNLEWVSREDNTKHAMEHDLKPHGDKHKSSKLKQSQVDWIREHYDSNDERYNTEAMTKLFGVSRSTIRRVVLNESWKLV